MDMTIYKAGKNIFSTRINNLGSKAGGQFANGNNLTFLYAYICTDNPFLKDNFST